MQARQEVVGHRGEEGIELAAARTICVGRELGDAIRAAVIDADDDRRPRTRHALDGAMDVPAAGERSRIVEQVLPVEHDEQRARCGIDRRRQVRADTTVAEAVRRAVENPEILAAFAASGTDAFYAPPAALDAFVASEIERYRKVVADSGARVE